MTPLASKLPFKPVRLNIDYDLSPILPHAKDIQVPSPAIANLVMQWDTQDTEKPYWKGYGSGGFDDPLDRQEFCRITFTDVSKATRTLIISQAKSIDWLLCLAFESLKPFTGADAKHYGAHPKAAWKLSKAEYQQLIQAANSTPTPAKVSNNTNVRLTPNGTSIGLLNANENVTLYRGDYFVKAAGYLWCLVDGRLSGWVARERLV